jgi:hypothetical protein
VLSAGLCPLALAAQFLQAGADRHEIISSTGSVHGVSSHIHYRFETHRRLPTEIKISSKLSAPAVARASAFPIFDE